MFHADARLALLIEAVREAERAKSIARARPGPLSHGGRPPSACCVPTPPGLSISPPPGLEDLDRDSCSGRCCGRWGSDCSTTGSSEVASTVSPVLTPCGSRLPSREASWARAPQEASAGLHAYERMDRVYSPGSVLTEAANLREADSIRLSETLLQRATDVSMSRGPSVGSAGHHLGLCRACDFTSRKGGCREGAACKFCHLCGPEVSRRRKSERRQLMQTLKQGQRAAAVAGWDAQ